MTAQKAPFTLFMLMVVFSPLAIDIFLPAIPAMAEALRADMASVQALVGLFVVSMGVGQLLAGPLADRYGRRPVALAGMAIYVLAALLGAWANSIEWLWASRLLQGLGTCGISVAAFSGVRDSYPKDRLTALYSYLNGVICIVPALAPLLGGLLTEWWGWRANFYFMAGYGALAMAVIAWRLPETRPAHTDTQGPLLSFARFQPVLSHPVFLFYGVMNLLAMAVILAYVSYAPAVLMVEMEQTPMAFAQWFGLNAAINIAGAFMAPSIIARVGKRRGLQIGVGLCVLACLGLVGLQHWLHPLAFMGPVFLASVGFCFLLAISGGAALVPFGERAGTASALLVCLQMSGAALALGLVSLLPLSAPLRLALLTLLPLAWWLLARRRGQAYQQVQAAMQS
ncbi:multidrug effflux MFS transporter [Ferrimonas marina]|uniref:Bcr/CflA family efflux transporter n=1 Tax=Ferrimonas marina TaxID=299255 RepID=A0A1M5VRL0_9GAMM|nr:multidrug effflux MFS transporter [Ferrimonas marina]SHH77867.1 MFS transporter, DHA1 family, bicyclomycin/chloramphenicol resistance protein [Ferrimonas marina]